MVTKLAISTLFVLLSLSECVDRVLLRDVTALTLTSNAKTTGRRSSPVPQLKCVGGTAYNQVKPPDIVQCHNAGFDGSDVQWECRAEMDSRVRFGSLSVTCEGYNHPDDPYVLKGSCGLEYELDWKHSSAGGSHSSHYPTKRSGEGGLVDTLITYATVLFIVGVLIYSCWPSAPEGEGGAAPRRFGGFGGGFDGGPGYPPGGPGGPGGHGPPPSYDDATGRKYYSGSSSSTSASDGPGFWTGMGLGAMGGYFAGQRAGQGARYRGGDEYSRSAGFFSSDYSDSRRDDGAGTSTSSGFGGTTRR